MSIRFTQKVRNIINHIATYGFITNSQCAAIFYKNNKQPYIQAQVKLKLLYDNGIVIRTEYKLNKEYVYSLDNKEINEHKMVSMNLYAFLCKNFKINYFKLEESWQCKKRNDAHIIIETKEGDVLGLLCEIDLWHKTSQEKLDILYDSREVHNWYKAYQNTDGDYYPSILIINNTGKTNIKSDKYDIVATGFEFEGLLDILP